MKWGGGTGGRDKAIQSTPKVQHNTFACGLSSACNPGSFLPDAKSHSQIKEHGGANLFKKYCRVVRYKFPNTAIPNFRKKIIYFITM